MAIAAGVAVVGLGIKAYSAVSEASTEKKAANNANNLNAYLGTLSTEQQNNINQQLANSSTATARMGVLDNAVASVYTGQSQSSTSTGFETAALIVGGALVLLIIVVIVKKTT